MTLYAVGDIQGCLTPLQCLLKKVNFNAAKDQLWAAGDIVNRGPQSLETLRFLKSLGSSFRMVLGNHDLHLLAIAHNARSANTKDTLNDIFIAPDRNELLNWLQNQPLLINDHGYVMVHAGIPPQWTLLTAEKMAKKVERALRGNYAKKFFINMYGNEPPAWHPSQREAVQLRTITNYFTRMRFCDSSGKLELNTKGSPDKAPDGFAPWYTHQSRKTKSKKIIFGHWAALNGEAGEGDLYPLDTGCVWGARLRLMNVDDKTYAHCPCS